MVQPSFQDLDMPASHTQHWLNVWQIDNRTIIRAGITATLGSWLLTRVYHLGVEASLNIETIIVTGALFRLLKELEFRTANTRSILAFFLAIALCTLPFQLASVCGLIVVGMALLPIADAREKTLFALLMATSLWIGADSGWRGLISGAIVSAEAKVMAALVNTMIQEATAFGNFVELADGRQLVVLRNCSIVYLLGPAVIVGIGLTAIVNGKAMRVPYIVSAILLFLLLINFARLLAMAHSDQAYAFAHDGLGATLFLIASYCGPVIISLHISNGR